MPRIFQTQSMGEAHLIVAVVNNPGMADLCVHRVNSWGEANKASYWYINYNREDASVWIYFGSIGMADIKICFVDNFTEAGWKKSPPPSKARRILV